MQKFKTTCQHCGKKHTYSLSGYESEVKCKSCKKELNTKFDFSNNTLILY